MLYFYEIFASIPSESCHKYVLQVCLFSPLSVAPSLGWVAGVASAWRVSGMLRRDITGKGSSSPHLSFPVGRVFSPQADVAGESVLGMLLCGGRSRGLVKTSWSSHLATQSSQDSSGVTESSGLLGRWVRCHQPGIGLLGLTGRREAVRRP